jgi:fructose-bisphosphate aldolase class I
LDQSGGSTPKALGLYGVGPDEYNGDEEMFNKIHEMRTRIVSCPAFNGNDVLGAILFEMTMDREFNGMPAAQYLWEKLNVVPFVKCDKGLAAEANDCQLMKPMPDLDALMRRAASKGVFGTKERSLIKKANPEGIKAIVAQQFEVGKQILAHGLMPILEPEVDINSATKKEAEALLLAAILEELNSLPEGQQIMLKLSIPTVDNLYKGLVDHPKVLKVVALSGGYSRDEANRRLSKQNGMIASFSRALTEGLNAKMSDEEYNAALGDSIRSIHQASST